MYYIDACIWRDYAEDRSDRFRPLGEWAFQFLRSIVPGQDIILVSDLVIEELGRRHAQEEITGIFSIVPDALRLRISSTHAQETEAKRLARDRGVTFGDALHAILARDQGAIMITRDRHFEKLTDIVTVKKPEDLL